MARLSIIATLLLVGLAVSHGTCVHLCAHLLSQPCCATSCCRGDQSIDRQTSSAGRSLLETDPRVDQCECGPHVDPRTPAEICATSHTDVGGSTFFCNAGGYFPDLASGCAKFFTCDAAGQMYKLDCGPGTMIDVVGGDGPHHRTSHRDRL